MRLVVFVVDGSPRLGALLDADRIVDLRVAAAAHLTAADDPLADAEAGIRVPPDTARFLLGGERSRRLAEAALHTARNADRDGRGRRLIYRRDEVRLDPPLRPGMIVCGGGNFWDHLIELGREKPEHVEFFLKNPHGVLGPDDAIPYQPRLSQKLDYEAELGIVVGRRARNVPRDRALDYVAGYTAVNDMAIRDRQIVNWHGPFFQLKYGEGKTFDGNLVLGPAVVTRDEIAGARDLSLRCWVDGELRQDSTTGKYIWGVEECIEFYSRFMTLEPGFLICPGTPGGCAVGSDRECGGRPPDGHVHGDYLRPGQRVVVEVGQVGRLDNLVEEVARS